MSLVGHEKALAQIPRPIPPTLLLTGPEGVGKRTAALMLASETGAALIDQQILSSLTREYSRALLDFHRTTPLAGPLKVSVVDLTGATYEVNPILRILEDPPPFSRFILHTDTEPLLTIRSRCFSVRFGSMTEDEVATVLGTLGVSDPVGAARFSQGRVSLALLGTLNPTGVNLMEQILLAVVKRDPQKVEWLLSKALAKEENETPEQVSAKRESLCHLLARSLRASIADSTHALAHVCPTEARLFALNVLNGSARPALRLRSAVWVILGDC